MTVRTYTARVTETDSGFWFIKLDNASEVNQWDTCWGGRATFETNREDLAISGISIEMKGE